MGPASQSDFRRLDPVWTGSFDKGHFTVFKSSPTFFFGDDIRLAIPTKNEIYGLTLPLHGPRTGAQGIHLQLLATGRWESKQRLQHVNARRAVVIHADYRMATTTHYQWRGESLFRSDGVRFPWTECRIRTYTSGPQFLLDPYTSKAMIVNLNMSYVRFIRTKVSPVYAT